MDEQLFANLADQLERLEPGIDPYGDPDLLEQWILCIGNIMRQKPSMSMFVAESGPTQGKLAASAFIDELLRCTMAVRTRLVLAWT